MPRPLSDAARAKMLEAAAELVVAVGVHGFTVDEVARRSGVARTTIYRHFRDPRELLVAALDRVMTAPPTPDTGSLRGDLTAYLTSVRENFADAALRTVFFEIYVAAARDPELRGLYQSLLRARTGPTLAIYENGRARGEISADVDYPTMLDIVQGPFVVRSLMRPESLAEVDIQVLVERMCRVLGDEREPCSRSGATR